MTPTMTNNHHSTRELARYLAMLAAREPAGGLLELRYRNPQTPSRMRQHFHRLANTAQIARHILALAEHSDVYIGVAPRRIPNGGRHAVHRGWVLWADIDQPGGQPPAAALPVAPGVVINSGTPGHHHLYWPLRDPLAPAELERANQTLAAALGADAGAVLGAATILRPPGTRNHKHTPPTPVTLERFDLRAHTAGEILHGLPAVPPAKAPAPARQRERADDLLLNIAPADYVAALTGQAVPRDRKINCPLHEDRTPSLHVYPDPEHGWHCYGCNQGGTIYDLAAKLSGLDTRGSDFTELRARLTELLLPAGAVPSGQRGLPRRG
jgi:hypothetical protein